MTDKFGETNAWELTFSMTLSPIAMVEEFCMGGCSSEKLFSSLSELSSEATHSGSIVTSVEYSSVPVNFLSVSDCGGDCDKFLSVLLLCLLSSCLPSN